MELLLRVKPRAAAATNATCGERLCAVAAAPASVRRDALHACDLRLVLPVLLTPPERGAVCVARVGRLGVFHDGAARGAAERRELGLCGGSVPATASATEKYQAKSVLAGDR